MMYQQGLLGQTIEWTRLEAEYPRGGDAPRGVQKVSRGVILAVAAGEGTDHRAPKWSMIVNWEDSGLHQFVPEHGWIKIVGEAKCANVYADYLEERGFADAALTLRKAFPLAAEDGRQ